MASFKTKVAIIGTNGVPAHYGGFETLCEYLVRYLNNDFDLYCYCAKTPQEKRLDKYNNTTLIYLPYKANGWQSMIYDSVSILRSFHKHDVLVILGFSGFAAFPFKRFHRDKRIIFNIGGVEWQKVRGARFTAKIEIYIKKWMEKICVRNSDVVICDNQAINDYVEENYKIKPILAEYGGNHAVSELATEDLKLKYPFLDGDYDVTVSRAQEDMNIHIALEAYKNTPKRKLVVISNWWISDYGINLKKEYLNKYSNIVLLDAIYNQRELNAIRGNCKLYLHTHSLCGTAPSLTEAMSLGLPVVCFDVPTNHFSTEGKSYYFNDATSLSAIIEKLNATTLNNMGEAMKEIADRRYTWERITDLYKQCIINR